MVDIQYDIEGKLILQDRKINLIRNIARYKIDPNVKLIIKKIKSLNLTYFIKSNNRTKNNKIPIFIGMTKIY